MDMNNEYKQYDAVEHGINLYKNLELVEIPEKYLKTKNSITVIKNV